MWAVPTLLASLAMTGCGFYTNIPAQILIGEVKPATLNYELIRTDGTREIKIEVPTVTLRAEPGSIGFTVDTLKVTYFRAVGSGKEQIDPAKIPPLTLGTTFRVESSNFPSDPSGPNIDQTAVGKSIYVGRYTYTLPIITRHVEAFGALPANYQDAAIYAQVSMSGVDDANFPSTYTFFVPITFNGLAAATN